MLAYSDYITQKRKVFAPRGIALNGTPLSPSLFDYQQHCLEFAVRTGASGLFLDTGLGKTAIELGFADYLLRSGHARRALLLTPLAVAQQIVSESQKLTIGEPHIIREQAEAKNGLSVCNYDRLHKLTPSWFDVIILDESSILKSFTGVTSQALIRAFAGHRWKLSATATPAPNDHMELGQQCEWLSVMPSNEMLMRWFIADQSQMGRYRLKRHGAADFYRWMASWSRMARTPADLGYDGSRFSLPPLQVIRHSVETTPTFQDGELFAGQISATSLHKLKRQTTAARADCVAELVSTGSRPWVIWCDTNYESDALAQRLPEAIEVRGAMGIEEKEERIHAFSVGQSRVIITKPSICGWGLNWQHVDRVAFVGRAFSYEQWYQAVRRCWRFGQANPVEVHLAIADGEDQIGYVLDRKAADHQGMCDAMTSAMLESIHDARRLNAYAPTHEGRCPAWFSA